MNNGTTKVVLITGAKGGLGTYVTNAFLNTGACVAGVSRSIKDSDFPHDNFTAFPAEISSSQSAVEVVNSVSAKYGTIDTLVHLMGGFAGSPLVENTGDAAFESMMNANFWSATHMVKAVLPVLRSRKGGSILAIGSRTASEPVAGLAAYSASKAALISLIRTVALEGKDAGVRANVVVPGAMDTPANRAAMPNADFSKWVDPAQVAALLVHLASCSGSNITGAVIPMYGKEI